MGHNNKMALWFLFPGLAGFLVFYFLPFIGGIYFCLINNAFERKFIGVFNFVELLKSEIFILALKNTFIFTALCVPAIMAMSLLLAVLLRSQTRNMGLFGNAIVLPLAIPSASVILVWNILFENQGLVNHLLCLAGLKSVEWIDSDMLRWPVVLLYIWKNCGYCMILFMTGLSGIPDDIYEAASIDGAGWWRKLATITLPLVIPTIFFVLIISIINSFKIFKETWLMGGSAPPDGVYLVQHYINHQMSKMNYEKLTTAAYIFAALIYIMVFFLFKWENRAGKDGKV